MSHNFFKVPLLAGLCLSSLAATAQNSNSNKENIPYTRYGIGDLLSGTNVALRGEGNLTAAMSLPFAVNTENPASYAGLQLTTYEIAGIGRSTNLTTSNSAYASGSANLAYLNLAFPATKYLGFCLGVKPQSKVYYKLENDSVLSDPALGKTAFIYSGDGGLNFAYIGASVRAYGLSLGANFGYQFGTTRNSSVIQQLDTIRSLSSEFSRYTKIGGVYWEGGIQYAYPINTKITLRAGGVVRLTQTLNATQDAYSINFRSLNGITDQDTSYKALGVKGSLVMPSTYRFGLTLEDHDKWNVGAEVSTSKWEQYRLFGATDSVRDQTLLFKVGGSVTPNPASLYNYFQRISYRLGAYYGTDYLTLRGNDIKVYAVTFGFSFPFKRTSDRLHTAFEIGSRGTENAGLIKEKFFRFSLGLSLNDRWFVKRRYD